MSSATYSTFKAASISAPFSAALSPKSFVSDAWQSEAQWHVFTDGDNVVSAIYRRSQWVSGPDLAPQDTYDPDKITRAATTWLANARGIHSLGVIFHVGDDFGTAHVLESMAGPEQYETARTLAIDAPGEVLDERPSQGCAFRVVPTDGNHGSVAIKISTKEREGVFDALATADNRILLSVTSSPLELLHALSLEALYKLSPPQDPRRHVILILIYPRFAAMATVNQNGELCGLLSMPSSPKGVATGITARLFEEVQNKGFDGANIYLVQAGGNDDSKALRGVVEEIQEQIPKIHDFDSRFEMHGIGLIRRDAFAFTGDAVANPTLYDGLLNLPEAHRPHSAIYRPEFTRDSKNRGLVSWRTSVQNFSAIALKSAENRLRRSEALLVVGLRILKYAAVAALLVIGVRFGVEVVQTTQSAAWKLEPKLAAEAADKATRYIAVNQALTWWTDSLKPRSESWVVMEFLSQLFPEERDGAILQSVRYQMAPYQEKTASAPSMAQAPARKLGYVQSWKIDGISMPDTTRISTKRVADALANVEQTTGRALYTPSQTQRLQVSVTNDRQNPVTIDGAEYSEKFSVTIEIITLASDKDAMPTGSSAFPPATLSIN